MYLKPTIEIIDRLLWIPVSLQDEDDATSGRSVSKLARTVRSARLDKKRRLCEHLDQHITIIMNTLHQAVY
jgi:hypothetical protein